jgi:hypothetical protein
MANSFKGQVAVEFRGSEIVLVLDFNTLADFEDKTGLEPLAWMEGLGKTAAKISEMRAMVWAAMHQTDDAATIRDAGDLMSEHPDILARLVAAAAPEAKPGNEPSPQKRATKR